MMPKKILTVDDSRTMRDMLLVTLKQAGYDATLLNADANFDGLYSDK